ncbi:UDP-GlcNAc:undecaprenyl-phosphate GlcNAc-1-phosphate transferase [Clostridium amylolyticum]|uniref:UDP-GlcNAc:undecaprenyl-phosphate GlcNAc-1-phosphate transferase n=2 Tax=Clostridium amylolyticum TaxID=1121298 RepID=A0A1M6B8G8_9CLOT|nr:UDP-GlcNAc:undecaprenyl-phosphate GlcNAc-1-phosphate transferase [Clostridium amylolyticum]
MKNYFMWILISATLSFILTPIMKTLSIKLNILDIPKDKRKIHKNPMPLLGGVGIYLAFIITILIMRRGSIQRDEIGILLGALVVLLGGLLDDIVDLKPYKKLLFQIISAAIVIYFGVVIKKVTNPFIFYKDTYISIKLFSIPLTIVWIVGVTNAINLMDGLDGLASGISLIACITMFFISILSGRESASLFTAVLSGAIIGFIPFNFNPADIFLGDNGAQVLGFLLASISIQGTIKSAAAFSIVVPILALGLPIYDTIFAMIRRKINGKPIYQADKGHIHHRLLAIGLTQRQVVTIMYIMSAILGAISIFAMEISTISSYFLLLGVVVFIVILAYKSGFFKNRD